MIYFLMVLFICLFLLARKIGQLNIAFGKYLTEISILKEALRNLPETKDMMERVDKNIAMWAK